MNFLTSLILLAVVFFKSSNGDQLFEKESVLEFSKSIISDFVLNDTSSLVGQQYQDDHDTECMNSLNVLLDGFVRGQFWALEGRYFTIHIHIF